LAPEKFIFVREKFIDPGESFTGKSNHLFF
jgi:hypothetical protein